MPNTKRRGGSRLNAPAGACSYAMRAFVATSTVMALNGLRYEHVAGFGVLLYQNTPKLDAGLKAK